MRYYTDNRIHGPRSGRRGNPGRWVRRCCTNGWLSSCPLKEARILDTRHGRSHRWHGVSRFAYSQLYHGRRFASTDGRLVLRFGRWYIDLSSAQLLFVCSFSAFCLDGRLGCGGAGRLLNGDLEVMCVDWAPRGSRHIEHTGRMMAVVTLLNPYHPSSVHSSVGSTTSHYRPYQTLDPRPLD